MQDENNKSFFDSKSIIAILIVGLVWFGWQSYLTKKYPEYGKPKTPVTATAETPTGTEGATEAQNTATTVATGNTEKTAATLQLDQSKNQEIVAEKLIDYSSKNISFQISNYGMGLKNVKLNQYTDRENNLVSLGNDQLAGIFSFNLLGDISKVVFSITQPAENVFVGEAIVGGVKISREMTVDSENYLLKNKISVSNLSEKYQGVQISIPDVKKETHSSWLMPSFDKQEFFVKHEDKATHIHVATDKEQEQKIELVSIAASSHQYFTTAILDKSTIIPEVLLHDKKDHMLLELQYKKSSSSPEMTYEFMAYAGPKSFTQLDHIDKAMADIIDYGFFSMIAKVLLGFLQAIHQFVGNWGLAIIVLTLFVRLLVMPFNMASYRSMKKMQVIQPLLQAVREKHKDDPTTMQKETMAIMREKKVNPVGGCLPMLLQMPVFFALYQALGQSIELYKAPFVFWISDLSLRDPYFVLPVIMGGAMYLQQKMTPSTMDPAQARIMQFMPIVFSLMMFTLPSGLTLYMSVTTIFSIMQQYFFMKTNKTA